MFEDIYQEIADLLPEGWSIEQQKGYILGLKHAYKILIEGF